MVDFSREIVDFSSFFNCIWGHFPQKALNNDQKQVKLTPKHPLFEAHFNQSSNQHMEAKSFVLMGS